MKITSKIAVAFSGFALLALSSLIDSRTHQIVPVAIAAARQDDDWSLLACSLETVKGRYATETTGSIVSAGPIGLVADVGVITFDGVGGASQTSTVSLNGVIIPHRSSLNGSYTVNPDCTGSLSLTLPSPMGPVPSTSNFVIVNHGAELRTIVTGAGRVLAGTAKRL